MPPTESNSARWRNSVINVVAPCHRPLNGQSFLQARHVHIMVAVQAIAAIDVEPV
jgi:hypothetical protein